MSNINQTAVTLVQDDHLQEAIIERYSGDPRISPEAVIGEEGQHRLPTTSPFTVKTGGSRRVRTEKPVHPLSVQDGP